MNTAQNPLHETCCMLLLLTCGTQTRETRYNLFTAFWNTYGGFPRLGHAWLCSPFPRVPVCRAGGPVWALMMNCREQSKKVWTRARISWLAFKGGRFGSCGEYNLNAYSGYCLNQNRVVHVNIMLMQKCSHQTFRSLTGRQRGDCCWAHKTTPGFIYMEKGPAANGCASVGRGAALNMYLLNWISITGGGGTAEAVLDRVYYICSGAVLRRGLRRAPFRK